MQFFESIPNTTFEFNGKTHIVKDILRRATFISEYKPYTDLFTSYTIHDGETVHSIALREYGSVNHYWVLLLFNEILNPLFGWPLDQQSLNLLCIDKYGEDVMMETKHYEYNGNIVGEIKTFKKGIPWTVPEFPGFGRAVTFYEYESELNDKKREINILRPELLGEFVTQFREFIND